MHPLSIHSLKRVFPLLFLIVLAPFCRAETVRIQLLNGDQITGTVVSEDSTYVVLSNLWLKATPIPLTEIKSRQKVDLPEAIVVTTNTPVAKPVATVTAPKPAIKPKGPKDWNGDIQIGTDVGISETRRQLYHGRFKITYAPAQSANPGDSSRVIERFRNTFDYNAAYGRTDGVLSANRMDGSSKTDFDLGSERRVFVYNLLGAGYDEIRAIDWRYEAGPGIGYHLLRESNLVLNVESGLNYQAQYFRGDDKSERFYYRFAEDFTWKISERLTFDEKFEFFPQMNFEQYRMRFESNLRYWLWENVSFNFTVLDIYDTDRARNVSRNDLQIRSSVGVKF